MLCSGFDTTIQAPQLRSFLFYFWCLWRENSWYFSVGRDDGVDRTQSATKAHQQTGELLHEFPFEDRQSKPERPSNQRFPKWSSYSALLCSNVDVTAPSQPIHSMLRQRGRVIVFVPHKWIYMNKIYSTPMNAFFFGTICNFQATWQPTMVTICSPKDSIKCIYEVINSNSKRCWK